MPNEATHWTLEMFGGDNLTFPSLSVNDELMTFPSFKAAAEMAEWKLEGGPEEGHLPIIGILAHVGDPTITPCAHCGGPVVWDEKAKDYRHIEQENSCALALDADGWDPEGWSAGWTQYLDGKVTSYEGDYENDPDIWKPVNEVEVVMEDGTTIIGPLVLNNDEPKSEPKREILVHLNVEVEQFDERTADQIADFLLASLQVGGEGHEGWQGIGTITIPLAEEI